MVRECHIFGPGMVKNSIHTTGGKLISRYLEFSTSAFDSGDNLDELCTVQVSSSLDAEFTMLQCTTIRVTLISLIFVLTIERGYCRYFNFKRFIKMYF